MSLKPRRATLTDVAALVGPPSAQADARKEKVAAAFRTGVLSTMVENKKKEAAELREGSGADAAAFVSYFADLPDADQRANLRVLLECSMPLPHGPPSIPLGLDPSLDQQTDPPTALPLCLIPTCYSRVLRRCMPATQCRGRTRRARWRRSARGYTSLSARALCR